MSDNFEREIPKARISISVDLHTGGSLERVELPLKLLVMGDYSAGQASDALAERKRIDVNKSNFDAVLAELNPKIEVDLENALEGDNPGSSVALGFKSMKDFEPESVAAQIPQLQRLIAVRVYQLKDRKSFDGASYDDLLKNERAVLSADLQDTTGVVVNPGSAASLSQPMRPDTEYIAIVGFFRNPKTIETGAAWCRGNRYRRMSPSSSISLVRSL